MKFLLLVKRLAAALCVISMIILCVPEISAADAAECGTQIGILSFDLDRKMTYFAVKTDESLANVDIPLNDIYLNDENPKYLDKTADDEMTLYFDTVILKNRKYTLSFDEKIKTASGRSLSDATVGNGIETLTDKNDSFNLTDSKSEGLKTETLWNSDKDHEYKIFAESASESSPDKSGEYVTYKLSGDVLGFSLWAYTFGSYKLKDGGNTVEGEFSVQASEDGTNFRNLESGILSCESKSSPERFPNGQYSYVNVKKYETVKDIPNGIRYLRINFPRVRCGETETSGKQSGNALLGDVEITYMPSDGSQTFVRTDSFYSNIKAADTLALRLGEPISDISGAVFKLNGEAVKSAVLSEDKKTVTLTFNKPLEANSEYALTIDGIGIDEISPKSRYIGFHTAYSRDSENYKWKSVNIGGGGMITGLVFHPTEENLLYARTDVGGMYRRDYENDCWISLMDGFTIDEWNSFAVNGICVDPNNADVVYATCGGAWYARGGIYKSNDRGKTWKKLTASPVFVDNDGRLDGECIAVDPSDSNTVYCGTTYEGLLVSHDGGENWTTVSDIPISETRPRTEAEFLSCKSIGIRSVYFIPDKNGGYAPCVSVYGRGIYTSSDRGKTWNIIPDSPKRTRRMVWYDNKLYASCRTDSENSSGLYCYDGESWKSDAPIDGVQMNGVTAGTVGGKEVLFCGAHSGRKLFYKADREWHTVFNPSDASNNEVSEHMSWITVSAKDWGGVIGNYIGALALNPNSGENAELWLGDGWSVWSNYDALNSKVFNADCKNIEETVVNVICAPPSGDTLLMTGIYDYCGAEHTSDSGICGEAKSIGKIYTTDPIQEKAHIYGTSVTAVDYCSKKPNYMAFCTDTYKNGISSGTGGSFGVTALSKDGGKTWNKYSWEQSEDFYGGCVAVGADGVNPDGVPTVISIQKSDGKSTAYAMRSTDFGKTWTKIESLPTNMISGTFSKNRNIVAADRVNGRKFYVYDKNRGVLYYSDDNGESFKASENKIKPQSQGKNPSNEYLNNDIEANPNKEGDVAFNAYDGGLLRSTDSGRTLLRVDGPEYVSAFTWGAKVPGTDITSAFVLASIDGKRGVYRSDDDLKTWIYLADPNMGLGCAVTCLEGDKRIFGRVYMGTGGRGAMYADIAPISKIWNINGVTYMVDGKNESDWLTGDGLEKKSGYYEVNGDVKFEFNADCEISCGGNTDDTGGIPMALKFMLGTDNNSSWEDARLSFIDENGDEISSLSLSDCQADDWLSLGGSMMSNSSLPLTAEVEMFALSLERIPSKTKEIRLSGLTDVAYICNVQAAWNKHIQSVTFVDDKTSSDWLIMENAGKMGDYDPWHGWYANENENIIGSVTFSFDGYHTKIQNNHRYNLNGPVENFKCAIGGYGYKSATDVEIEISDDGKDYRSIGNAEEYVIGWANVDELPGWMNVKEIELNKSVLGTETKFIRFKLIQHTGIIRPEITYMANIDKYEINDVTYTIENNGIISARGKVYPNLSEKKTASLQLLRSCI